MSVAFIIIMSIWGLIATHHIGCKIADNGSPPGCCGTLYCDKDEAGLFCDKGTLKKFETCRARVKKKPKEKKTECPAE